MDTQLYRGLTQYEANKPLANLITQSGVLELEIVLNMKDEVECFEIGGDCDVTMAPFTESLDSTAYLRKAMNREQQLLYSAALKDIIEEATNGSGGLYEVLDATPEQHVCAALKALGLGTDAPT
jgi:hypothetical protein